MKSYLETAAISFAAVLSMPAIASAQTFNTTGNMADNGTYGDALFFKPTDASSKLQMRVTGWQSNQATNAITTAWVGAYSPGSGVTGLGDLSGSYDYYQIDNAGGYTDFVLLQFNAPVALKSLNLNSFTLGGATTKNDDFAIYAASIPETSWDAAIDLAPYVTVPSLWATIPGSGNDGVVPTGATVTSSEWLVGAAFNSGNNDGFKIASVTVAPTGAAVPEPASWAMMILGAGMIGFALRGRRARAPSRLPPRREPGRQTAGLAMI